MARLNSLNDHIILIVFYITIVSILSLRWHIIDVEFHHKLFWLIGQMESQTFRLIVWNPIQKAG